MKTAAPKSPRKKPHQAHAQASVSAILEAAIRVFEREGPDAATTTRVAEVAGVSVGTLYQYFADRQAIVDALQEREFERALALMSDVLSRDNLRASPKKTIERVIRGLASLYESQPALHRTLAMDGLRSVASNRVQAFDIRVIAIVRHFLSATGAPMRRKNLDAAAFIAFQAVRATMLASLLERPAGVDSEALVQELADLLMRYLVDAPAPRIAPKKRAVAKPKRKPR